MPLILFGGKLDGIGFPVGVLDQARGKDELVFFTLVFTHPNPEFDGLVEAGIHSSPRQVDAKSVTFSGGKG